LYRILSERLGLGLRLLIPSKTFAVTRPTERIAVFGTKSILRRMRWFVSAVDRCFPRERLQPPCPGKGYVDVVRKERFCRPALKPVPASSSNASEYASSAQGNKEVYSSSPLSSGSSDTCWDWDCAYSPHRKLLFLQGQSETPQNDSSRRLTGHPQKA